MYSKGLKSQLFANHIDQVGVYMRQPAATLVQPKRSSVGLAAGGGGQGKVVAGGSCQ